MFVLYIIDNNDTFDGINIYPNPIISTISISLEEINDSSVQIMNIIGNVIIDKKMESKMTHIDLQDMPKGMYLMRIRSNNKTVIKKVIKE
ncbi:T9SS type A sorting domain-containing protein [Aquimarina sp. RZ0]|uniref:T9SS type A sorting domain-containing protein n=1 Tax=Aquimarina sp. RZ0 TaxID=2607730 RepID=UPI00165F6612|nr:T9SS type A sorting domain-containing protein [Aquimarina sp. RZ0]